MLRGREVAEQINILGDDGVPLDHHETFWKSELIDFIIYQQDAFDDIDQITPLERQGFMMRLVMGICAKNFAFDNFEEVSDFFKRLINLLKQMNYSEYKSEQFEKYLAEANQLVANQSEEGAE